ncbi:MAG: MarC family protein [Rubrobacter sp.]|nr:MarC family protein [Rubrobacter sp.]
MDALGIGFSAFRISRAAPCSSCSAWIWSSPVPPGCGGPPREQEEAQEEEDISGVPLAIPLIAGPGSLTTVLLYTDNGDFLTVAAVMTVLLVVLLLVLASLLLASRVMRVFGETGANVLARVLGVVLAAQAV